MYKIDKKIPLRPKKIGCDKENDPLDKMNVGDSFFIECERPDIPAIRNEIYYEVMKINNKLITKNKVKFTIRTVDNGIRCWKIK